MSRLLQVLLLACVAVALCAAEPPRHRQHAARLRAPKRRFNALARQTLDESVTPYPSAKELKPDVPFEEDGTAAAAGFDLPVAGPGSFDSGAIDAAGTLPAAAAADDDDTVESEHEPDLIYGPPETDVEVDNEIANLPSPPLPTDEIEATIAEEEDNAAAVEEQLRAERLVTARRFKARKLLRPATKARAARLQALSQSQFAAQQQPLFYYQMAQYRMW